jgi:hypothetical protein
MERQARRAPPDATASGRILAKEVRHPEQVVPTVSLEALLDEFERVPHDERMRHMVELGRRAAADPDVARLLDRLEAGDTYQRLLALHSVYGDRGAAAGARAIRGLHDPSHMIRKRAVPLAALVCSDEQLERALSELPPTLRLSLVRHLRKRRRQVAVDHLVERLAAHGDADFPRLYAYGSDALVERLAPQTLPGASVADWRRLARQHPHGAARALRQEAEVATTVDHRLRGQIDAALPILARSVPDAALDLVRAAARETPLSWLALQPLVSHRPEEMADLVLGSQDEVNVSFAAVAHCIERARLLDLIERRSTALGDVGVWFRRLPPGDRVVIYRQYGGGLRAAAGDNDALPPWLVALLPARERLQEARRHLNLPALLGDAAKRLPYAAFLPWGEALGALDPFLRNPDAELRSLAISALAGAVRFQRDRAPDLLALVAGRRNEQDPVRAAMLAGLAALPPSVWHVEQLDALGQVIRDALDAADLSAATAGSAEALIVHLLPVHPEWAAAWLATLVQERGQVNFHDLEQRLSDDDVRRVAPVLAPVLRSWETREREPHIIAAAQGFGRRLRVFPELADILEHLARESSQPSTAERALSILDRELPDRFRALVPELIERDKSWATRPLIYGHLHRRRQDLLTPFLGRRTYRGRFATGKTHFVLPVVDGFFRWTAAQQEAFAATLREMTGDEERDSPAILHVIRQLAALPLAPIDRLVELASLDVGDEEATRPTGVVRAGRVAAPTRLAVRDAALRALAGRDMADGVPVLTDALADDRARVAIYALRRAILALPADQALPLLRGVPLARVTVAKEVARLLGDLRSEEAFRELLAWTERSLHRDVHVAVVRGLWPHAERDEAWAVFERAAESDDAAVATVAGRLPADRLSPTAQRRLARLLARLLGHADPKVRLDALRRCTALPVADPERIVLRPLVDRLTSALPDEQGLAATALFATYAGRESSVVADAVRGLLADRRALANVAEALRAALNMDRRHLRATVQAVLEVLETDPLTAVLRVRLQVMALAGRELASALQRMTERGGLHPDALATAIEAIGSSASPLRRYGLYGDLGPFGPYSPFGPLGRRRRLYWRANPYATRGAHLFIGHAERQRGLDELEAALAGQDDERLRRIALAALDAQAGDAYGWTAERLTRLRSFRADPSPLVASAAQFTLPLAEITPPEEHEPESAAP